MLVKDMLRDIADGRHNRFDDLYKQLSPVMLAYATGLLAGDYAKAEDAVNEAFLHIWQSASRYSGRGNATGWIRAIVRNKAIDQLRKKRPQEQSMAPADIPDYIDATPDQETRLMRHQAAAHLRQAMQNLSTEQREAVHLCYFEGLSIADIAEAANCPQNTVKTRLFYARKQLLYAMQNEERARPIIARPITALSAATQPRARQMVSCL